MRGILLFLFILPLGSGAFAANCDEACADYTECASGSCKYCNGFVCETCCNFTDEPSCPTTEGCTWHSGTSECRDVAGDACPEVTAEIPKASKSWFLYAMVPIFLLILLFGRKIIKLKTK